MLTPFVSPFLRISLLLSLIPWSLPGQETHFAKVSNLYLSIYQQDPSKAPSLSHEFEQAVLSLWKAYPQTSFAWNELPGLMYFKGESKSMQLLNWSIPTPNGGSSYAGILQVWSDASHTYLYYPLQDYSSYQPFPEQLILPPSQWWGAYYYQCIEKTIDSITYFTLLGINYSQSEYTQKVLEVLQINSQGEVCFGAPIWGEPTAGLLATPSGTQRLSPSVLQRQIFRYSPKADFILRYDYQAYHSKNAKKKEILAHDYLIVFDRLMEDVLSLEGGQARWVPVGGLYDAYLFQNGKWVLTTNVLARNRGSSDKTPKKNTSSLPSNR